MAVKKEYFGTTGDGQEISSYTLDNGYLNARVIDYGAVLVNLCVPDREGIRDDIVLGFDRLRQYEENKDYFGATIGPVCNRTAGGEMPIDGTVYQMPRNDGGDTNNLHSDAAAGLHKRVWNTIYGEDFVTFTLSLADGEFGLPGERHFTVTYSLTVDNALKLHYHATSDKRTPLNLTNHSYFNLDGHEAGVINNTLLTLYASHYLPTDDKSIPSGEIRDVTGTPFDFRTEKPIGQDIDVDDIQLRQASGFDHNWCIDGYTGTAELLPVATARSKRTGRIMEVYSNQPGVQFYAGNYIDDKNGKNGHDYGRRHAFCLETQFWPDSIHHEAFPSYLYGKGDVYDAQTKFRFRAE